MRRVLVACVALSALAVTAPAFATDLPLKAPPLPPAPLYDWTGFYVGINGGYSWGNSSTSYSGTDAITGAPFTAFSTSQSMDGWLGGGQIGYNWQFNSNWLLGLEADIQGTSQKGSDGLPTVSGIVPGFRALVIGFSSAANVTESLPWFGTARARLGVLPSDHWLLYVTGGLAYGQVNTTATISNTTTAPGGTATVTVSGSQDTTNIGWTIGGGTEWMLAAHWTAKVEYLYIDLGTVSATFAGTGAYATLNTSSHVTDNILRGGINYRF
jgi:outer membrane immunogenic protein